MSWDRFNDQFRETEWERRERWREQRRRREIEERVRNERAKAQALSDLKAAGVSE